MSDPLIDPLRVHTYGVKRPLEEKRGEIQQLYQQAKRYYPDDKKVKVDEWGAVIKNQSEAFRRMQEENERMKKDQMQSYGQELESEVFNKLRKQQDAQNAEKRLEMEMAMQKKAELDQMNALNQDRKKQMQSVLAKEYEDMIRMKENQKKYERMSDLHNGQMANSKAAQEMNFLQQNEQNKKKMIKEVLTNAKNVHDGVRHQSEKDRYVSTLEDKRHMEEMERRQRERDMAQLSRYNQFNQFQNKNAQAYTQQVINPKMEKDMQFNHMLRKQEMETKRKAEQAEEKKNKMKRDWAMDTRMGLEKQMKAKNEGNQALVAEHMYDQYNTRAIENDINNLKNQDFLEKKARQTKYKEMLDNQKKTKDHMKMYGNMTGIEKQMNKNDLTAFKHYDAHTYALIPGLNSKSMSPTKKVMEEKISKKNMRTHEEEVDRMNQFGLTRDVTLIKNPGAVSNAHRSSMDDITGHKNTARSEAPAAGQGHQRSITSPNNRSLMMPSATSTMPLNNFNNHHLYNSYNPISGQYSPDKQAKNQARTTFRYAAARNMGGF